MKFAKELDQDLVPEWRVKYLNYKAGKKYIKAVSRSINKANGTPRAFVRRRSELPQHEATPRSGQFARQQNGAPEVPTADEIESLRESPAPMGQTNRGAHNTPKPQPTPIPARTERQSLTRSPGNEGQYGSFVPTPPSVADSWNVFELPGPALGEPAMSSDPFPPPPRPSETLRKSMSRQSARRSMSMGAAVPSGILPPPATPTRSRATFEENPSPGRLRRIFSAGHHLSQQLTRNESMKFGYGLQTIDTVRDREKEFFDFLDSELDKVETFYRQKEEQAGQRLAALREQLHEMRNRRNRELAEIRQRKERGEDSSSHDTKGVSSSANGWVEPIKSRIFKPGANSKAFSKLHFTPVLSAMGTEARRDYIKRSTSHEVSYRTAKRKLKLALQEFYRGLELLQSYAQLNRTAFRKLNKKYDKAVNARPPYRYMNEKVNKSWFVNSTTVEGYIHSVEDLYARYFEKGNHKIASGKLHRLNRRPGDESANAFQNGLFIGTGAVFALQGLVYGSELLFDPDPEVQQQTSYLMQLYAGYFLMLFLMFAFCLDCYMWTRNKINYPFIFEFDTRNNLDWRQLSSFPSFFLLLFGIFFWINFTRYGSSELYLYYPVILIVITLVILLLPAPILWHRSRQWLMYSHYRLFFAGLYPVEFRDFFLGDMYCSLTYATSNVELFFCLYSRHWNNPVQCNSNNSRLLGFFSALPPIWRALQCIRRYRDTRNVFPHLVNGGKYGMTIMAAVTLSIYRMRATDSNLGLFVTFSTMNGIYTSIWDLFMDFSFFQPDTRHRFLRDILGLKRRWLYYAIMILDPILRFGWIFYAIFTHDKQHSTLVSFFVALAEVTRRGMWALFRVENEHCANVAQYKASRDVPLPYHLHPHEPLVERVSSEEEEQRRTSTMPIVPVEGASASAVDISTAGASALGREQSNTRASSEAQTQGLAEGSTMRWRRKPEVLRARSIRGIIADAHKQDFEKRRRPTQAPTSDNDADLAEAPIEESEGEDDDDESTGSMIDERLEARRAEGLVKAEGSGTNV
ncbi:EXS-domain-containing protein [Annulohypoxylon maeteangense]|uniref:EXS-domain-containing protein n=1 Tax=Annulohypoxylon maeteangense TaxID=1927788 RepID=UPI002007B723|nr:EXS-domain-containing protein [Annulohypoxylon maeteangense]KAI0881088.1 EXS-domain-containing protein [Annulohypoxylon maeteangense]